MGVGSILSGMFWHPSYTLGELMQIDQGRQMKAASCSVSLEKIYHELKEESLLDKFKVFFSGRPSIKVYYIILKFNVIGDTGNSHKVFIRLDPDFSMSAVMSNRVKIYCDCGDFKYRSAFLLNQHNSIFLTDRIRTNLGEALFDAPKAKTRTTLLCKHAFAAVQWLISNYSSIMSTI